MIDPYFRPSDKTRDLSRNTVLFSSLSLFFSIYHIPMTSLPFVQTNLDPIVSAAVLKRVNIASILLLVAVFSFLQTMVLMATEYVDGRRLAEAAVEKSAYANEFGAPIQARMLDTVSQEALSSAEKYLTRLTYCNYFLTVLRILIEIAIPSLLIVLALYREGRGLLGFLSVNAESVISAVPPQ